MGLAASQERLRVWHRQSYKRATSAGAFGVPGRPGWTIIEGRFPGRTLIGRNHNRRRLLGLACLLAIAALYAPLAAAAFSPSAMACCTSGFCNIPKHHHKSNASTPASASAGSHEDCGHNVSGKMAGINDCSMDCCQAHETTAVNSVAFVMPPVFFVPASMDVTRTTEIVRAIEIPRTTEPASPPPRLLGSTLQDR
jgi:hypothetical protein